MKALKSIVIAGFLAVVSCAQKEPDYPQYTITVDQQAFKDVAANNPGVEALVITTDAPYWIMSAPEWVTPDARHGVGDGKSTIVALTIDSNYKNIATTTYARSGEIKISGGRTSVVIPINQLGHTAEFDPDSSIGGIPNEAEFMDFVNTINDGEAPIRWMNQDMEVELLADLDLSSVTEWTPIGDVESAGNGNNQSKVRGNPFSGVFNGGNHTIRNFNVSADLAEGKTWGLFGYISHATIKNLNLEADLTLTASGTADAGVLAGTVFCSTVENVKVTAKITSSGTTGTHRFAIGGIAGFMYSQYTPEKSYDSYIKDCRVTATVNLDCGDNTTNGADCVMYGGIAAFATNIKDNSRNHIVNCVNSGTMTVNIGRCSGILPTANYGTYIEHCTNNASQVNTVVNGRVGQICCNLSAQSHIIDCVNTGNLTTTNSQTTTGAIVALMGDDTVYLEGGDRVVNTGTIIGANANYLSLLCANTNRFHHISDVILGGKIGKYKANGNHQMYSVNNANITDYIGYVNPEYSGRISNISYTTAGPVDPPGPDDPEEKGISSADDFLAFAAAVNAGGSTAQWENEEGWVTLLDDIDFSGVSSWTPVGHVTAPWGSSYNPLVESGKAFTGKFDGNAHHIRNLVLTDAVSKSGEHFGIFGYLGKGAIVQNFVIDGSCSLTVTSSVSHSAGMLAGVAYDAVIRDVTSYAPMTYNGSVPGYFHMAIIGGIYANESGCTIDSVHNRGDINATDDTNWSSGAAAIHVAGIVGFANAGDKSNVISSCNNYGALTSEAGRTAGILGAANRNTEITLCENHGDQLNTMPNIDGGRLGSIVCLCNNGSSVSFCKNYGKLVSTTSGRVGGIVSLANKGLYEGNENYGDIISDSIYRGVLFGNTTQASEWKGGKASGRLGKYNGGDFIYDVYSEADKFRYLGKDASGGAASFTGVEIDIATGDASPSTELDVNASFRILFIGNSFTMDAVTHLPGILSAAGLDDIQMVHMYYGGRTIPEYNDGWSTSTDYYCYVCNPGQTGWTSVTGISLASIAATGKWDVVTIQEHTGRRLAWEWTAGEKAAVQGLMEKVKASQSLKGGNPKLYYILSQAYHDISKAQSGTKPFTDTDGMWTCIAAQCNGVIKKPLTKKF